MICAQEVLTMAIATLPTSEIQTQIGAILNRLNESQEPIFVSHHGRTEAVLLSLDHYNAIMDLLEDREDELDAALGQRIQEEREAHARGTGRNFEAFVAELESPYVPD
jgi:prevent-host-death family protein